MPADREDTGAGRYLPRSDDLEEMARAVRRRRGRDLYRDATQAVFGRGASGADAVPLGEQPGDVEDEPGRGSRRRAHRHAGRADAAVLSGAGD